MNDSRGISRITLILILLTGIWVCSMVLGSPVTHSNDENFSLLEQYGNVNSFFHYVTYLSVVALTFSVTLWKVSILSKLSRITSGNQTVFIHFSYILLAVYCSFNVVAYASQITIVPVIVQNGRSGSREEASMCEFLLRSVFSQTHSKSAISFLNFGAYAILAFPSFVMVGLLHGHFQGVKERWSRSLEFGNVLLLLSGVLSILGLLGKILDVFALEFCCMLGGVVFILCLFPYYHYFRNHEEEEGDSKKNDDIMFM